MNGIPGPNSKTKVFKFIPLFKIKSNHHPSSINLHHSSFFIHPSSFFILHSSFIILHSSLLHFTTFKFFSLFWISGHQKIFDQTNCNLVAVCLINIITSCICGEAGKLFCWNNFKVSCVAFLTFINKICGMSQFCWDCIKLVSLHGLEITQ